MQGHGAGAGALAQRVGQRAKEIRKEARRLRVGRIDGEPGQRDVGSLGGAPVREQRRLAETGGSDDQRQRPVKAFREHGAQARAAHRGAAELGHRHLGGDQRIGRPKGDRGGGVGRCAGRGSGHGTGTLGVVGGRGGPWPIPSAAIAIEAALVLAGTAMYWRAAVRATGEAGAGMGRAHAAGAVGSPAGVATLALNALGQ